MMRMRVQVIMESDNGKAEVVQEVAALERRSLKPEELGLTLAEAKNLLVGVQQAMVHRQVEEFADQSCCCRICGKPRSRKGKHKIVYRTLFGKLQLDSPRYYACSCEKKSQGSTSPMAELLSERTVPELIYLETKFASLMSYGLTVEMLAEVLPLGSQLNATGVHRRLQQVAERIESELGEEQPHFIAGCQRDRNQLPPPGPPLTVGLDGGYVHAKDQKSRTEGWFEVIVGKSVPTDEDAKCLAFVSKYDTKPKRRLFELLKSQGMQPNQQIEFFSDGGETVRNLPLYLNSEAEHYLDWFHIVRHEGC